MYKNNVNHIIIAQVMAVLIQNCIRYSVFKCLKKMKSTDYFYHVE
jgi:hypothetical protein